MIWFIFCGKKEKHVQQLMGIVHHHHFAILSPDMGDVKRPSVAAFNDPDLQVKWETWGFKSDGFSRTNLAGKPD